MRKQRVRALLALSIAGLMLTVSACSGAVEGVPQEDFDAVQAELDQAKADLAAAEQVVVAAPANQQVVQTGELVAAPAPGPVGADGWSNEESVRGGLELIAQLDSSGDDAWDIEAHPRVYFTSESYQTNNFSGDAGDATLAALGLGNFIGWHVIDAYSKEVIASALYEY